MNLQVQFLVDGLDDDKLGTFDMSAAPNVGESVELDGDTYVVESRSWHPKKLRTHVTVTLHRR